MTKTERTKSKNNYAKHISPAIFEEYNVRKRVRLYPETMPSKKRKFFWKKVYEEVKELRNILNHEKNTELCFLHEVKKCCRS